MKLTFEQANTKYQDAVIGDLSETAEGLRFLLLRSLSRARHLKTLANATNVNLDDIQKQGEQFRTLYNSSISIDDIKVFAKKTFQSERAARAAQEPDLINELYKMKEFYWGGLHQNSLEK